MSISNPYDDYEKKANSIPTVEQLYSNLKDNEIILDRGCYYGRCIGLYMTLDTDTGYARCPFCGNGRQLPKEEIADILESRKYNTSLTERVWANRKDNNLLSLQEKLKKYKTM